MSDSGGRGASTGAGRLIDVGGLYAPRFPIGLIPPPGMPMRRFTSAAGLTKFGRPFGAPIGPPVGAPFAAPFAAAGAVAAALMAALTIGSDFPWFIPLVRGIEGLSA